MSLGSFVSVPDGLSWVIFPQTHGGPPSCVEGMRRVFHQMMTCRDGFTQSTARPSTGM